MIGSLLGLVALIAALAVGWRKWQGLRLDATRPGRSESSAITVSDYGEIDAVVRTARCRCGTRLFARGEGSRQALRIVHLECGKCEREYTLYFDVRAVRH
ncbi:MAG: hypothetical protein HY699_07900 [Deltaproteobacteria bacterium]|nr:hypothetical protein [Deltaproteobacteria bacterium]